MYKGMLASNFKSQQQNNKKIVDHINGLTDYLSSFSNAQEKLLDSLNNQTKRKSQKSQSLESNIVINISDSPGISRWDSKQPKQPNLKGKGSKTGEVANVGGVVFNTSIIADATPAEKDKYKKLNEENRETADRIANSLETIAKEAKKKKDQDTSIKKSFAKQVKDLNAANLKESGKKSKMMSSIKESYKKISAKLPKMPFTSLRSMANKALGMYYKMMEYVIAYEITKTFAKLGIKSFKVFSYISTMPIKIVKSLAQGGWKTFNYLSSVNVSGFLQTMSIMPKKTWEGVKFFFRNPKKAISDTIKSIFSSKEGFKAFLKSGPKAPGWLVGLGIPVGVYWVSRAMGVSDEEFSKGVSWFKETFKKMSIFKDAWGWLQDWSSDRNLTYLWREMSSWYSEFQENPLDAIFKVVKKSAISISSFAWGIVSSVSKDMWRGLLKPVVFSVLEGFGVLETLVKAVDTKTYKNYAGVKYGNKALMELSSIQMNNMKMRGKTKEQRKKYIEPVAEKLRDNVDEMYAIWAWQYRNIGNRKILFQLIDEYEKAFINGDFKINKFI